MRIEKTVYVTNYGSVDADDLPPEIRRPLWTARFTKDGMPDKRSKHSVEAWDALNAWMRARIRDEIKRYTVDITNLEPSESWKRRLLEFGVKMD